MISVGVRQLKNGLTRYLRLVEKGESLLVTNRNRTVAILKKPDRRSAHTVEEKVGALVAEGRLVGATDGGRMKPFKPITVKGTPVSKMIIEDRR